MEKEKLTVTISAKKIKLGHESTQDFYLDDHFLFWPSLAIITKTQLQQLSHCNIHELIVKEPPDFLNEQELNQHISLSTILEQPHALWSFYEAYFSVIELKVNEFRKTGQIQADDLVKPYTTFRKKLKDHNLGLCDLIKIREVATENLAQWHIHFILTLTILVTLQGQELKLDPQDLKDLATGALLCTLGFFLIPSLNQRIFSSARDFLAHDLSPQDKLAYETYPILSHRIGVKNRFNANVLNIVLSHRELLNQQGFPHKPLSFKISQASQILGMAYRFSQLFLTKQKNQSLYHHFLTFYKESGESSYDKNLIRILFDLIVPYKLGNIVQLANGNLARVFKINNEKAHQPFLTLDLNKEDPPKEALLIAGETEETKIIKILSESEINLL